MSTQVVEDLLALAVLWILWCGLHSGMISTTVTQHLKRRLGNQFRFYRLFYNAVALATLFPVLHFRRSIDSMPLFRWDGWLGLVEFLLLASGVALFVAGARHYDLRQFLGLRQIASHRAHLTLTETGHFESEGILRVTRHPWYLAALLLVWSGEITTATLVGKVVLSVYLFVGAYLEERKLVLQYGDAYRRFQADVSMILPVRYFLRKAWKGLGR